MQVEWSSATLAPSREPPDDCLLYVAICGVRRIALHSTQCHAGYNIISGGEVGLSWETHPLGASPPTHTHPFGVDKFMSTL